jgi:FMN phosphatase YigB (HAD superfamily)
MKKTLIIVDLDNTLYDWVTYYSRSFRAMLKELSGITGLDEQVLKASFKRVHEKHGTSEYSFSIEELDVLESADKGLSLSQKLDKYKSAIEAFRANRDESLQLYPGVVETLSKLRSEGRKIVAHTDSMMYYALYRVQRQLLIAGLFDGLFAVRDHGLPAGVAPSEVRRFQDPSVYKSTIPVTRELAASVVKPNREVLQTILSTFSAAANEAIYVGDSLGKDIWMAKQCGVTDVFAGYGKSFDPRDYELLIQITHWSDQDVQREIGSRKVEVIPSFTIKAFPELIDVIASAER